MRLSWILAGVLSSVVVLGAGCGGSSDDDGGTNAVSGAHVMWGMFTGTFQAGGDDYGCVDSSPEVLGSTTIGPFQVTLTVGGSSRLPTQGLFYPPAYLYVPASGANDSFNVNLEGGTCDGTVSISGRTVTYRLVCGDSTGRSEFTYTYVYSADFNTIEATMEEKVVVLECGGGEYVTITGSWTMTRTQ